MKLAVQLYSLRHHMENGEDFLKILEKVKALGFEGVEFAGFHGYSPGTLRKTLDSIGLVAVGAHMGLDDFKEENLASTLKTARILGMKAIGIGGADTRTETALERVIDILGEANKKAKRDGIKVYFHNHTEEFKEPLFPTQPGTIFDRLKKVCYMQLDTYWSYYAGIDNRSFIAENRTRLVHLHIKDGIGGVTKALGEGDNDLTAIVEAAERAGITWLILENDDPKPNGLADIERSMRWLKDNVI